MKHLSFALLTLATVTLSALSPAFAQGEHAISQEEITAQCQLSPDQDRANAEAAVRSAVQNTVTTTMALYKSSYSNFSYDLSVGSVNISGADATAVGSLTLRATNVSNNQPVGGTYGGVVSLVRKGCNWDAVGYSRR